MNTQEVWDILSNLSVGKVVSWVLVIFAILAAICTFTIKLYKVFEKYRSTKEKYEEQKELMESHDNALSQIKNALKDIQHSLSEQREVNLKQIRYSIVHTCDEAIANGYISAGKLKSLEEMFEEYVKVFHGNGYVKILMDKVRELPIVGKLDD